MRNAIAQPVHRPCTTRAPSVKGTAAALLTLFALSGCSPGSVVAGTIGAAGVVAGTAVDVVLKSDTSPADMAGVLE